MKNKLYIFLFILGLGLFSCNEDVVTNDPGDNSGTSDSEDDVENILLPDGDGIKISFTDEQLKFAKKKGLSLTENQKEQIKNMPGLTLLKMGWFNLCDDDIWHGTGIECVHVADIGIDEEKVKSLYKLVLNNECKRIIAFDVPNSYDDLQTSVDNAINTWALLQKLQVPLGSPVIDATSENTEWFDAFMAKISELQYRVNYLCVKYHSDDNVETFKTKIEALHAEYDDLPIIITGLSVIDADAHDTGSNEFSEAEVKSFLRNASAWLEEEGQDYIYGYSWTSFDYDNPSGCSSALINDKVLTGLGDYYINEKLEYGDNLIKNPGFESGLTSDWGKGNNTSVTSNYTINGNKSVLLSGTGNTRCFQDIKVEGGKTYILGLTARIHDKVGPSGSEYTTNEKLIINVYKLDNGEQVTPALYTTTVTANTNTLIEFEITLDKDVSDLRFNFYKNSKKACVAYVDDVYVKEVK